MRIRVLDIETTGFTPPKAKIVEIGSHDVLHTLTDDVKLTELDVTSRLESYVNPEIECGHEVTAVHHLMEEDWAQAPLIDNAVQMFAGADLYCAHNAKFEQQWLRFTDAMGSEVPWLCTYKIALKLWPKSPKHTNQVLRYYLGLCTSREERDLFPHRAWPDAYVTAHILMEALKLVALEELLAWSGAPIVLEKVTFGKYANQYWRDVPTNYLQYMLSGDNVRSDVADTCRHHLKLRNIPGFFYG